MAFQLIPLTHFLLHFVNVICFLIVCRVNLPLYAPLFMPWCISLLRTSSHFCSGLDWSPRPCQSYVSDSKLLEFTQSSIIEPTAISTQLASPSLPLTILWMASCLSRIAFHLILYYIPFTTLLLHNYGPLILDEHGNMVAFQPSLLSRLPLIMSNHVRGIREGSRAKNDI